MSLAVNISTEKILNSVGEKHHKKVFANSRDASGTSNEPRYDVQPLPKHSMPSKGIPGDICYKLIRDELTLDGTPLLNLASFVHTYMHPGADKLMQENVAKNLIDSDEYPATTLIHQRTVSMIAKLWHADESKNATGTATTGSSEAIQLAGLAMKKLWQEKMIKAGKDERRPGPNIVMGANAQVALEKFARYFDVECRLVPVDASTKYCLDPKRAIEYCDENTIGIFVILGSTYTGHYEDVKGMADELDKFEARTGIYIPIHVDGASGSYVAPFVSPGLVWDFRIPRVVSINGSAHKYGKAYVGVGYVIWRDSIHLPKEMIFELHYLGSIEYSFSLNFSRPAAPIIGFYFNLVHFGFEGYRSISLHDAKLARLFSRALEASKFYEVVSDIHRPIQKSGIAKLTSANSGHSENIEDYIPALPVVAFKFSEQFKREYPQVQQKWIQTLLRARSWIVPNYELPNDGPEILRVVVRENLTEDLVERLFSDLMEITEGLMKDGGPAHAAAIHSTHATTKEKSKMAAASHGEGVAANLKNGVC